MSRSYVDLGLDAVTTGGSARAGEELPPWMTQPAKEPTQEDLRDWFFGTAGNALVFGLGMMMFTHEKRAGGMLVKAAGFLALPGVALAVIPPEPKKKMAAAPPGVSPATTPLPAEKK